MWLAARPCKSRRRRYLLAQPLSTSNREQISSSAIGRTGKSIRTGSHADATSHFLAEAHETRATTVAWCRIRSSIAAVSTASPANASSQLPNARGQDHRALLVAFRHDLEDEACLLSPERQVSDLVDDEKLRHCHRSMHDLLHAPLPSRSRPRSGGRRPTGSGLSSPCARRSARRRWQGTSYGAR